MGVAVRVAGPARGRARRRGPIGVRSVAGGGGGRGIDRQVIAPSNTPRPAGDRHSRIGVGWGAGGLQVVVARAVVAVVELPGDARPPGVVPGGSTRIRRACWGRSASREGGGRDETVNPPAGNRPNNSSGSTARRASATSPATSPPLRAPASPPGTYHPYRSARPTQADRLPARVSTHPAPASTGTRESTNGTPTHTTPAPTHPPARDRPRTRGDQPPHTRPTDVKDALGGRSPRTATINPPTGADTKPAHTTNPHP